MIKQKTTNFFSTIHIYLSLIISAVLVLTNSLPIFANNLPDNTTINFYNQNGIYYYNAMGSNSRCYTGDINIAGSTAAQKIWSGLTSFMTPEQAAGVMGNMQHESNYFNPVQHEVSQMNAHPNKDIVNDSSGSYGVGLIQWSGGRRTRMLQYIQSTDASLMTYFLTPSTYSVGYTINGDKFIELAGEDVFDRLVQLELEFLKEELNTYSSYSGIFQQNTVYDAAKFFLEHVEIPQNPTIEAHPERATDAQAYYDALNGAVLSPSGSNGTNTGGSSITIIGDSITEGSKSQILSKLPEADINSEVGRQFTTGIEIAKSMSLRRVVVFALGTNNAGLTSAQVDEAVSAIGQDKNIYFVTNYGTADYYNNNNLLKEAISKYSNVSVIDWAKSVSSDPSKYISGDGVHPTAEGRDLFANLIYNAVTANNLTSDGCTVSGDLQSTVLRYAWPEYHPAPYTNRMPDYAEAVTRRISEGKYVGGSVDGVAGIDCGGFVTTLVQESGFAPEYNGYASNVPPQEKWVRENGWTLVNGDENTVVDTGQLQPGDVAFSGSLASPGHTFIYVGDIDGFDSKIASASYSRNGNAYARAPMAGTESLTMSDGIPVRWYRKG